MRSIAIVIVSLVIAAFSDTAAVTSAQSATVSTKPPHRQVQTTCAACVAQAKAVNQGYDGLNFLWDRKLSIEKTLAIVERITGERAAEIARLESAAPPSGRTASQQQAIDSLKHINEQQRSGLPRQRRQLAEIDQRIAEQDAIIAERLRLLAECEKQCATPPADPPLTATAGPKPEVTIPDAGRPTINVNCPPCRRYADHILDLLEERAGILEEMSLLETELEMMAAGLSGPPVTARRWNDPKREGIYDDLEDLDADIAEIDAELLLTWSALTNCILACNFAPRPFYTRPLFYGPAIGSGLIPLLNGLGGDKNISTPLAPAPPASTAPPPAPPVSTPSPTPPTTVEPTPQPTIAGVADCTRCAVMDDSGRHDLVINLCPQLTGGFDIAVGSITIRHAAPFVDLVGAQYDPVGGMFRGTTRGTVAGSPNVGITAEGTANAVTGEIRFLYTMGTGGELPGGRSITYSITLQKRR